MKNCQFNFDTSQYPALEGLKTVCGTNLNQFYNYLTDVIHLVDKDGHIDFTDEFKQEWNKNKRNGELSLVNTDKTKLCDKIIQYYKERYPSSTDTNREGKKSDKAKIFGYTNVAAREEGKIHFINAMIGWYHFNENKGTNKVKENLKAWYCKKAMDSMNIGLAKQLSEITGIPAKEILSNLTDNNLQYIKSILKGHEDKVTMQLDNRIALYTEYSSNDFYSSFGKEMPTDVPISNPRLEFFEEILLNSNLGEIRFDKKEELNDEDVQLRVQEDGIVTGKDGEPANENTDTSTDEYITQANTHFGQYTDFMTHVSAPLKALLGSLRVSVTTEVGNESKIVFDTNNYFGIPLCMNANTCASVLYHYGEYDSVEVMMQSIKKISKNLPGFAAFEQLYKELLGNPNLQYAFYRTFKKLVISKVETTIENGEIKLYVSNNSNNPQIILYNKMLNAFKGSALNNTTAFNLEQKRELAKEFALYNPSKDQDGSKIRALSANIAEFLQTYFPFINEISVRNFILYNTDVNGKENIKYNLGLLLNKEGIIDKIIDACEVTRKNYAKKQSIIRAAAIKNYQEREAAVQEGREIDTKKMVDMNPIFASSYISSETESIATQLSKLLSPFTPINTSLNSRDPYGHQSSDVINDSMITNIIQTLESGLNNYITNETGERVWNPKSPILRLGEHRSQSTQYDFSNILIEHTDEKGNVINKGLFRKDKNGKWIPTDDARNLLKIAQYNGASNRDNENNASYADMTHGDYLSSAWKNFFNTDSKEVAGYFMRIPSDAPKTFIVNAPRYSAENLLIEANKEKIDSEIKSIIDKASSKIATDLNLAIFNEKPVVVYDGSKVNNDTKAFINHIQATPNNSVDIKIPRTRHKYLKPSKDNIVKIAFRYKTETSENNQNVYVMQGYFYDGVLHNATFEGFKEDSINDDIWKNIKKVIKRERSKLSPDKGGIQWTVDTNHRLFKQLYNVFQQELVDMVVAGDVMFKKNPDKSKKGYYYFTTKNGKPIFNQGFTNTEHNGLHPTYHFKEEKEVKDQTIYDMKDGQVYLNGKVFHSDRFVIYDEDGNSVANYGEEILKKAFPFFYGAANDNYLRFKLRNGQVTLDITPAQKAIIEEEIKNFIIKYVEEARNEMSAISNLDNPDDFTSDKLAEFVLNYHLTYIGFNDLFEGDTKFYKNTQTFLKRAKEVQGSGVPYGMADLTRSIESKHLPISSPLTGVTFFGDKKVQMYDGFSAITVYNSIHTDTPMLECLVKQLTNKEYMGDKVLSEEKARALLYGPKGDAGYQETTVNDAQSYITFDEWIRRITGRGQLEQYKELINRVLDESKPLDVSDIEELIQVQKNFYYDQYYNANTRTISPRQIKNAEFVLIPRLVRGTELEKIAQLMDKLGVDQLNTVETSKSGQGSRFTLWDHNGNLTQELVEDLQNLDTPDYKWKSEIMIAANRDATKSQFKEYFNYNYLYTQQETKQHLGTEAKNKAGIQIMKKIIDNIDANAPKALRDAKDEYFRLYSKNIEESFNNLMRRLNVNTENGNIKVVNGQIEGLDYNQLYDMLKEELVRLGMDSNTLDYCTVDENSPIGNSAKMPSVVSLVGPKFENIVQSLFNRNITRQLLPGFHAAQVTGLGFQKFSETVSKGISSTKYGRTSNPLKYHYTINEENGEYEFTEVVEIMLPCSAFGLDRNSDRYKNLSREEQNKKMLQDLHDAGLDTLIGYRIPTEGKQSICYMKIADFTDEAYGSTIVVPDAWVSQTGADFDIDSVYGIQYKMYTDSTGKPHKIKYYGKEDFANKGTKAWYDYLAKNIGGYITAITDEEFNEIKKNAKESASKTIQKSKSEIAELETIIWESLPTVARKEVFAVHDSVHEEHGTKLTAKQYKDQLNTEIDKLKTLLTKIENGEINSVSKDDIENINAIKAYININGFIIDPSADLIYPELQSEDSKDLEELKDKKSKSPTYKELVSGKINDKINKAKENQKKAYERIAEAKGLLSEEDFLKQAIENPEDFNSADARTNGMIDCMIKMLTNSYSLEENLSRSNFDDITAALNKYNAINAKNKAKRAARSPYNIFSQAYFQEDAMSGAKLKGISVVRDTFCSVMNTVRPVIPTASSIKIAYDKTQYSESELVSRFGKVEESDDKTQWIVTHNTFGWTRDNKNIDGKILTSYSSQTTAHILDAMKAGNVTNVNELTFQIYKTFVDIGSNYDMAISFIMQPGIAKIVEAYNNTNSIYSSEKNRDYVKQAIRAICDELNIEYDYKTTTKELLNTIENQYGDAFRTIGVFGNTFEFTQDEEVNSGFVLSNKHQSDRLEETGIFKGDNNLPVEDKNAVLENGDILSKGELKSLYDLAIILQFDKISKLVDDVRTAAMVSNPDKFGAKQTIFATRKIFDNIYNSIVDNTTDVGTKFRLQVDGKHVIEQIYPNIITDDTETIDDVINNVMNNPKFVTDSKYPFLASFLKYSTIPSIIINQTLFETQQEDFRKMILDGDIGLQGKLSNGNTVTEQTAADFQNYIINYLTLHKSRFLQAPLKYNYGKGGARGFEYKNYAIGEFNQDEADRVLGLGYSPALVNIVDGEEVPFTVKDFKNIQQEEIDNFAALTPAQKISWVKRHFSEAPFFDYIEVNLHNELSIRQGKAAQTLSFDEDSADIETVYNECEKAFTNKNPFIALAAADVVKYAFYAEAYRIGMGNVSKMINNSILIDDSKLYGTGIIHDLKQNLADIKNQLTYNRERGTQSVNERLIENYIRGHYKKVGIEYHRVAYINKQYELKPEKNGIIYLNVSTETGKDLAFKYGIQYEDNEGFPMSNSYVRLGYNKKETLYRIKEDRIGDATIITLIPLNPLASNENVKWSAIDENNDYYAPEYYENIINKYINSVISSYGNINIYSSSLMSKATKEVNQHKGDYKSPKTKKFESTKPTPIKNLNTDPVYGEVVKSVRKWYPTRITDGKPILYLWNKPLSKHFKAFGEKGSDIYSIRLADGRIQNFQIQAVNIKKYKKPYLGKNIDKPLSKKAEEYSDLIDVIRLAASYVEDKTLSSTFNEIFAIIPVDSIYSTNENEVFSTKLDSAVVQMADSIDTRAKEEDTTANQISMRFRDKGVIHKTNKIAPYREDVIINTAKYIEDTINALLDKYENYVEKTDEEGFYSINDEEAIKSKLANPITTRELLRDILEPQRILGQFSLIKDIDVTSEDPSLEPYLTKIKNAIRRLEDSAKVKDGFEKIAKLYYDESTNNPMVKSGMISVLQGFYQTNWFNAQFNDIQETTNPIVQIAMRNFQADVRRKEFAAKEEARKFGEHMKDIQARAKAAGKTVDFKNIVDEYGRFKQKYNQDFINDRNRLSKAHIEAQKEFGRGSIQELEARLEYDEWKAKYVEQPVVRSYYIQRNAALRKALYGEEVEVDPITHKKEFNGKCTELLSLYEQLCQKRKDLRGKYQKDVENLDLDEQMEALDGEIRMLYYEFEDDYSTRKKDRPFDYDNANFEERLEYAKHSLTQARRLKDYIFENRMLEKTYFKYDPVAEFDTLVKKYEKKIAQFETSGKPSSTYVNDPEYIAAKTWMRLNAIKEPIWDAGIRDKINDAFESLVTEKSYSIRHVFLRNKDYRGKDGKFDPRLIPAEEMARLKEEEIKYNGLSTGAVNDKTLIGNGDPSGKVYSKDFYDGMRSKKSKTDNKVWQRTVTRLNELLAPYYNEFTNTVDLSEIPVNAKGLKILEEINECYNKLDEIRGPKKSKGVKAFIEKYVDTESYNVLRYNADVAYVKGLPYGKFRRAMNDIIKRENHKGEIKPNNYLYGFIKPKKEYEDKFIDKPKTEAIETLNKYYEIKVRPEFRDMAAEMYAKSKRTGDDSYARWIDANTVYDPYTHKLRPLSIWTIRTAKSDKYDYYPKFPQTSRIVRDGTFTKRELDRPDDVLDIAGDDLGSEILDKYDEGETGYNKELDFRNKKYNPNGGHLANFRDAKDGKYHNDNHMNEFEIEASQYMQNTLDGWTKTKQGKFYLSQGWLPARPDNSVGSPKGLLRELAKTLGWYNEVYDPNDWYHEIDYSKDKPHTMPMLGKLKGKNAEEIGERPKQKKDETDEAYKDRLDKWVENKKRIELETHKRLLDTNWTDVIQDYIVQAGRFNAIQDAKYELFFARTLLTQYGHYIKTYNKKGKKSYKKNYSDSDETQSEYQRTVDKKLLEQFDNIIKRLVYNQYKETNSTKLIKYMSILQGVTSSQYMMMNIKGGIANVTLGESSIMQEVFAREHLSGQDWINGKKVYGTGLFDYMSQAFEHIPQTLAGQTVSFMDVVDYDEHTGVSRLSTDAYKLLKKFRNSTYTPQTAGEHEMQNSVMFALMHSNRLVLDPKRAGFGKPPYVFRNYAEYVRDRREDALYSILSEEDAKIYDEWKDKLKADENSMRDYAHYKKDTCFIFAFQHLNKDKQKAFAEKLEEVDKIARKEFFDDEKHPTIISQLAKGEDGILTFKKDSVLYKLHQEKDADGISEAFTLLAEFKGRVISVNKFIHGVYDKSGRAQFEKTWIGSLFAQYHKHLPVGIMKRYRSEGTYNEERGSVQKGMYRSIYDFLSIPFKRDQVLLGLTNDNVEALTSVQSIIKGYLDLAAKASLYYDIMPEYDKANFRRAFANVAMIFTAVCATIAIKAGWDDDDSLLYNMSLYQLDRFSTEAAQYIPVVAWGEAKKLYKSPIAAGSGITDALSSINLVCHMLIDGDEFDGEYHSGKFAGESKMKVLLLRRTPVYRGIESSFFSIKDNNQYYKISENILGFINVDKIAEDIKK